MWWLITSSFIWKHFLGSQKITFTKWLIYSIEPLIEPIDNFIEWTAPRKSILITLHVLLFSSSTCITTYNTHTKHNVYKNMYRVFLCFGNYWIFSWVKTTTLTKATNIFFSFVTFEQTINTFFSEETSDQLVFHVLFDF